MIKLYGVLLSNNVNKVRYCLNYLGLAYETIETSPLKGENKTEAFLAISPTGKVPAIDVDGVKIFESNAIMRYLASKQNSSLYPADLQKRAAVEAWLDYGAIHIAQAQSQVTFNRVLAPLVGMPSSEAAIKTGLENLGKFLPIVDKQLAKNKYLAGNELSLADINLLAILDPCEISQIDLAPYAHIITWRNALKQQPFYQKCYKDFTQFLQEAMGAKA